MTRPQGSEIRGRGAVGGSASRDLGVGGEVDSTPHQRRSTSPLVFCNLRLVANCGAGGLSWPSSPLGVSGRREDRDQYDR